MKRLFCINVDCDKPRMKDKWLCKEHHKALGASVAQPNGRTHKYGAVRTEVNGITFDSKAEAARYQQLLILKKAGRISKLRLQTRWPLLVSGTEVAVYVSDFDYLTCEGEHVVFDTKGVLTPVFRLKAKMFRAQYGFDITTT